MTDLKDWGHILDADGHIILVATHRGSVGCVYCGRIDAGLLGGNCIAFASLNLVRMQGPFGPGRTFSTRAKAIQWLHDEAIALARKLQVAMSPVGESAAASLLRPLVDIKD